MLDKKSNKDFCLLYKNSQRNQNLAIFIHGFGGDHLATWRELPNFLQQNAQSRDVLKDWDYLFLGYSTWHIDSYSDISDVILQNINLAVEGQLPFQNKYTKFSLFGHSLGTLGIRQLLCDWISLPKIFFHPRSVDLFSSSLKSVCLFGTPLYGTTIAKFAFLYKIHSALSPGNPQLRMLKKWTDFSFSLRRWPLNKVILGMKDSVFSHKMRDFVVWKGDDKAIIKNLGHSSMISEKEIEGSDILDIIINSLK